MKQLLLLLLVSLSVSFISSCRTSGGGSGSPGITRSRTGGGTSSGPGITRTKRGGAGHSPGISGPKRKGNSMNGPTRQHGKK